MEGSLPCLEWSPKSVYVPRKKQVTMYDTCGLEGKKIVSKESIECIEKPSFSLNAKGYKVTPMKEGKNLKGGKQDGITLCSNL